MTTTYGADQGALTADPIVDALVPVALPRERDPELDAPPTRPQDIGEGLSDADRPAHGTLAGLFQHRIEGTELDDLCRPLAVALLPPRRVLMPTPIEPEPPLKRPCPSCRQMFTPSMIDTDQTYCSRRCRIWHQDDMIRRRARQLLG